MPSKSKSAVSSLDLELTTKAVLNSIEREREQEIISRRFGLFDRKETLEQIGEFLGITRERVRQLEKVVVTKLKASAANNNLQAIIDIDKEILDILSRNGNVMRVSALAGLLSKNGDKIDQARIGFLCELSPLLSVIEESDHFYYSVGSREVNDEKKIRELSNKIVEIIKKNGVPAEIQKVAEQLKDNDVTHVSSLASTSKHLAQLNGQWGLAKWPTVNPRNIRDKIYVILKENQKHMHFNEIAEAIKISEFKRKDVTTQAIHNELIKDKRFVLIGRGIYALSEWGYKKGTVADTISEVLAEAGEALHRDEIVKRVLKHRFVKETTILLNLQGKNQFKRVAKATYALEDLS